MSPSLAAAAGRPQLCRRRRVRGAAAEFEIGGEASACQPAGRERAGQGRGHRPSPGPHVSARRLGQVPGPSELSDSERRRRTRRTTVDLKVSYPAAWRWRWRWRSRSIRQGNGFERAPPSLSPTASRASAPSAVTCGGHGAPSLQVTTHTHTHIHTVY